MTVPALQTAAGRRPATALVPHRLPAPGTEPPYDDEQPAPAPCPLGAGSRPPRTALCALGAASPPPSHAAPLRAVGPALGKLELPLSFGTARDERPALRLVRDCAGEPSPALRELPDPRPVAAQFVRLLLDAVTGGRPPATLAGRASPAVYRDVARLAHRRAHEHRVGSRPVRPAVHSIHVTEPQPDVAEVCAVIRFGPRRRAAALRFDGAEGRWLCTAVDLR
jgi:hypothetical protein